jgi:DNA repair exonuclease SbcCD ATPase subunit
MKNIHFSNVKIQNFLSIGDQPIEIDFQKGITVITGENKDKGGKNGIGKSTIADAIFWCLFGNTIRELKKDKIQHNKNDKECKVILNFSVKTTENEKKYTIIRTLDPAKIEIISDDVDITLSTIPKNDEFIRNLIGANEEVFNNAVIMSANNTIPFMAQKKIEKRKFIEGILQLNIFSDMMLKTRSEYNDVKKENDTLSSNFISEQKNLATFEAQKNKFDQEKIGKIKNLNDKIETNNESLKKLRDKKISSVEESEKEITDLENKIKVLETGVKTNNIKVSEFNNKDTEIKTSINQLKKEKQKIIDKGNTCPTCNREYCKDDIDAVTKKITEIDDEIKQYESNIIDNTALMNAQIDKGDKIQDGITKIRNQIKDLNKAQSEIKLHNQAITHLVNLNNQYNKDIEDLNNGNAFIDENIDNSKEKIKNIETDLEKVKKSLSILDSVKFIVSEEGIKIYIVKKIINILNSRLNYYLQTFDAPCKCVFDEMFEETIYNDQGKECSYFNFSGGERKRIDTAILFTFQDVMRCHSGTSFSLNIYDELFDCALDAKGTDKILEVLKEKVAKYDESIYIVSHKSSEVANCDNVIQLVKYNGVTRIVS